MIANVAFLAAVTTFLLVGYLAGELRYLAPYKTALFRLHGVHIGLAILAVFINLVGLYYSLARCLFLRDTGRKLQHLDRQLGGPDTILDDLRDQLTD